MRSETITLLASLRRLRAPGPFSKLLTTLLCLPLAAQGRADIGQADIKAAALPDPVKGMHEIAALTPAELAMRRTGRPPHAQGAIAQHVLHDGPSFASDSVLFDQLGDDRIWARSTTYKASFGPEGFVYVPFFGADAPKNYPVHFVLRSVRLGGRDVAFAGSVLPTRAGDRIAFDRGAVREIYDLTVDHVEQSFVVDVGPGDLEVEVDVRSELREDAERAGLQFGNAFGLVHYGTAFVVDAAGKREIASSLQGDTIRLHVPAARRGPGATVIDPIIHTSAFTHVTSVNCRNPDIAYDASFDRFMVVWEYPFSATDTDVFSEFRDGNGAPVAGSLASIDVTTMNHAHPRVANINSNNLFLVVMEREQGPQWQIWGRRRLANSTPQPELFPISDPAVPGHHFNPDVGGDPDASGPERQWLVVWERQFSASDFDIHGRIVRADTSLSTFTLFIENSANTIHSLPQVSQSNGNGLATNTSPQWMVVYQFRFSATDEDIYGAALSPSGVITRPSAPIDNSPFVDLVPCVSTPATELSGTNLMFMVTYERQSPLEARARVVIPTPLGFVNQITPVSLTASFGLGAFWVRPESDGCRFAVISGAATITVATLAYANNALVLHEAPQPLAGTPSYPRIASKRSGGGNLTNYGIAYVDEATTPDRIMVAGYLGTAAGNTTQRPTGCGGLGITTDGTRSFLGEELRFRLTNTGADVPGLLLGLPAAAFPVCFGCSIGVSLNGPLVNVANIGLLALQLPCQLGVVGVTLAVQGYAVGSGTCLGSMRFSDTIDFTIR